MKNPGMLRALIAVFVLWGLLMPAEPAYAAGVVGTGTPASCTGFAFTVAVTAGGLITFNCGPAPVIIFVPGTETINVDTVLDGGSKVTLDGSGSVQMFSVPLGHSLTVRNITLSNGYSASFGGGAIYSLGGGVTVLNSTFFNNTAFDGGAILSGSGGLTITNSSFFDNSVHVAGFGGAINAQGPLTINGGYFEGNFAPTGFGGALDLQGPTTITNSYFKSNSSNYGGAIVMGPGSLTLSNSVFAGNTAGVVGGALEGGNMTISTTTFDQNGAPHGGAVSASAGVSIVSSTFTGNYATTTNGGGLENDGSGNTVSDSTFTGNTAAVNGGAIYNNASLSVNNTTIAANPTGGGIYNNSSATISFENSILSGNAPNNCSTLGTLTSLGNNIDSAFTCNFGSGDQSGVDPLLGALANNGGPTETMSLLAGSPAIDGGSNVTCAPTDQRGIKRPQGGTCDVGAYEVRTLSFTSVGAYDGWVLETGKNTNVGGILDTTGGTLLVGDNALNRRYRGFLSFNTAALPNSATLVLARVLVKQQALVGNPFGTQGALEVDPAKPYFGRGLALVSSDWQVPALPSLAGAFTSPPIGGWYSGEVGGAGLSKINKLGTTQMRLRFTTEHYNAHADYLSVYSGNYVKAGFRPRLIVYFNP